MLFCGFPAAFLEEIPYSKKALEKIVESYLFKDVLSFNRYAILKPSLSLPGRWHIRLDRRLTRMNCQTGLKLTGKP